ncbi:MAG: four helix bundle protein [Candidatus Hydrogenedentes bacterium]|nr:four helix bundle protein [Candidatus Hydrogenedentota bacterium]
MGGRSTPRTLTARGTAIRLRPTAARLRLTAINLRPAATSPPPTAIRLRHTAIRLRLTAIRLRPTAASLRLTAINLRPVATSQPPTTTRSSHTSHDSHTSHNSHSSSPRLLPPRGDYRTLLSYQKSEVVYLLTYRFCDRFLGKGDRTVDQMVQAARSGKQNIVEGSIAGSTSKETEIKLTNVARASLEELLEDFRDFLQVRNLAVWDKDSKEAVYVRELGKHTPVSYETFREFVESRPAEVVANIAICLINQTNYLLDQQLLRLERDFLKAGGIRERMIRARVQARDEQMRRGQ